MRGLITAVDRADREMHGRVELSETLRRQMCSKLESCLVDKDRLRGYLRVLQAVLKNHARYNDSGCLENEQQLRAVEQHGLTILDHTALTQLALNPVALCALSHHIVESVFTDYWTDVLAQAWQDDKDFLNRDSELGTESDGAIEETASWAELVDLRGMAFFQGLPNGYNEEEPSSDDLTGTPDENAVRPGE